MIQRRQHPQDTPHLNHPEKATGYLPYPPERRGRMPPRQCVSSAQRQGATPHSSPYPASPGHRTWRGTAPTHWRQGLGWSAAAAASQAQCHSLSTLLGSPLVSLGSVFRPMQTRTGARHRRWAERREGAIQCPGTQHPPQLHYLPSMKGFESGLNPGYTLLHEKGVCSSQSESCRQNPTLRWLG